MMNFLAHCMTAHALFEAEWDMKAFEIKESAEENFTQNHPHGSSWQDKSMGLAPVFR